MKHWDKAFLLFFLIPSFLFAAEPYANKIRTVTTNFNTNLSAADSTVQKALDTLDELVAGGGGGAPTTADYLVGTANGSLSAEIVVGTTPGGELGGTWASPTVDTIHSGSAHHTAATITLPDANVTSGQGITFTQAGIMGITESAPDTVTFTATEVDGSITNELPIAGTYIDISGSPASTVDVDTTEMEAVTFGAGGNASNIWTFNLSGTDPTITFGSGLVTFGAGLTLTTGKNLIIGTTQWNSGDSIDGTKVANADLGDLGVSSGVYTVENAAVIGKLITGFTSGAGALAGTDTILQAINKLDGNVGTKQATVTEGSLADSVIVSADIKDGIVTYTDMVANVPGLPHHRGFTIVDPPTAYTKSTIIPLWIKTDAAIHITNIEFRCDANPTTEPTGDISYADDLIGLANATVIQAIDTAVGTFSSGAINVAVAAGKTIYLTYDAAPDAATKLHAGTISYDYD